MASSRLALCALLAFIPAICAMHSSPMAFQGLRLRGGADGGGAPPGMPPGFDMNAMNSMFGNPAFQQMASNLMNNPEFKQRMDEMMKNETLMKEYAKIGEQVMGMGGLPGMGGMGGAGLGGMGGGPSLGGGADSFGSSGSPGFTAGGMAGAPGGGMGGMGGAGGAPGMPPGFDPSMLGGAAGEEMQKMAQNMMKDYLKPEKLKELSESEEIKKIQSDPKMQAIINDVKENGPMAVMKYYSDPDAMAIFSKITGLLGMPEDFAKIGQDFAKMGGMPGMPGMGMPGAGAGAGGEAKQDANALE